MTDSPARFKDVCLDATDHQALADWWCAALGYVRRDSLEPDDGEPRPADWPVPIVDPAGFGPLMWIIPVPEPKTVKNRLHLDVHVGADLRDAEVRRLVGMGATELYWCSQGPMSWATLADPEGNEFCVM